MKLEKDNIYLFEEFDGEKTRLIEIEILDISPSSEYMKIEYKHNNFICWISSSEFGKKYSYVEKLERKGNTQCPQ